jgi:hypothetical protein
LPLDADPVRCFGYKEANNIGVCFVTLTTKDARDTIKSAAASDQRTTFHVPNTPFRDRATLPFATTTTGELGGVWLGF